MNYMTKIADYEATVERRLEESCEQDGWIASAHVAFVEDYVAPASCADLINGV